MSDSAPEVEPPVEAVLRIPGIWESPRELSQALPEGFSIDDHCQWLHLPDGSKVEFNPRQWDDEFLKVFAGACKHTPSERDRHIVENYTVQVCLAAPGGSLGAAHRLMEAGAAILKAGGGGVFIDNSGNAHGSDDWFDLTTDPQNTEDGDWGGVYWAYVATVGGKKEIWSIGMHVLGYRDAVMARSAEGEEADYYLLHNFLAYSYRSGRTIDSGDVLGDFEAAHHQVFSESDTLLPAGPMQNPHGRWRLVPANAGRMN